MASLMGSLRAPQCMSCMRRVNASFNDSWLASAQQQVRGKKKLVKQSTIKVRLLRDVTRYGKQGSVIPLPAGRMRNEFFPRRMAEYMTSAQIKELGLEGQSLERDYTFGLIVPVNAKVQEPEVLASGKTIAVDLDLLKHEEATKTIAKLLPDNIDFYRTLIVAQAPVQKRSPSLPASALISHAAGGNKPIPTEAKQAIYGSVSTADIAATIRAVLAEDAEGSRIVLGPEDIKFAIETEEKDRVKHIGTFDVDIRVKGAPEAVRRTITVRAQE